MLGRINASRMIRPQCRTFSGFRKNRLASFSRGGQSWPAHCSDDDLSLGVNQPFDQGGGSGGASSAPPRPPAVPCRLRTEFRYIPDLRGSPIWIWHSLDALPASGRLHAAGRNMASVCTRAGKFILARFVTIVGPSRSICSLERLGASCSAGDRAKDHTKARQSLVSLLATSRAAFTVGGGASQWIGPEPASNSPSRRSMSLNYHRRSRSVSSQTFPMKWPLTIILHCPPVRKCPSCRGKGNGPAQ